MHVDALSSQRKLKPGDKIHETVEIRQLGCLGVAVFLLKKMNILIYKVLLYMASKRKCHMYGSATFSSKCLENGIEKINLSIVFQNSNHISHKTLNIVV